MQPNRKVILADGDPNRTAIDWAESSQFDLPFLVVDASNELPNYDVLIVDTSARTEPDDLADLIETSTLVVIPTKVDIFDVRATLALGYMLRPYPDKYRILLTGLPRGNRLYNAAKKMFEDEGLKCLEGGIQQLTVYRDAAYEGVPVGRYNEVGKKAMTEYENIGSQIMKGWSYV